MRFEGVIGVTVHELDFVGYFQDKFSPDHFEAAFEDPRVVLCVAGLAREAFHADIEEQQVRVDALDF